MSKAASWIVFPSSSKVTTSWYSTLHRRSWPGVTQTLDFPGKPNLDDGLFRFSACSPNCGCCEVRRWMYSVTPLSGARSAL
ncbi:hypothetical protein D3C85_1429510 [compost metagenome]